MHKLFNVSTTVNLSNQNLSFIGLTEITKIYLPFSQMQPPPKVLFVKLSVAHASIINPKLISAELVVHNTGYRNENWNGRAEEEKEMMVEEERV